MAKKSEKLSVGLVFDDTLDSNDAVSQYVKVLGAWLSGRGHDVQYLVGETRLQNWAGGKVYSLAKNQTVYFNGNKLSMPLPGSSRQIKDVLASESFDILHVMVPYSPFMAHKVIKSAPANVVVVGTFHIFPSGWLARVGAKLLRWRCSSSLRRFSRVVSVSPAAADFAHESFKLTTQVIPNLVDTSRFKTQDAPKAKNEIVFLGRLVKRKGCGQLIEAFSLLIEKLPNVKLTIVGDGPERAKLTGLVKRLGLDSRITFMGHINEDMKPKVLAKADIACFPSLYGESFGIVLIEAMAAGAGVVLGGDNPGYRTVLGDQPKLLVNPRDKIAFADRLEELLTNQSVIDGLHSWQTEEVKQYDINVVGRQILELYRSAIADLRQTSNNKAHGFRPKSDS